MFTVHIYITHIRNLNIQNHEITYQHNISHSSEMDKGKVTLR